MSEKPLILRAIFSNAEIEGILWQLPWVEWEDYTNKGNSFKVKPINFLSQGLAMHKAVHKLSMASTAEGSTPSNYTAWLQKHTKGTTVVDQEIGGSPSGSLVALSLTQFRGGRISVSGFKGYVNPGEVMSLSYDKETKYSIENIASGEKTLLILKSW